MRDEYKEALEKIQSQIASFDSKANVLISVVGIVFGLALSLLKNVHEQFFINQSCEYRTWYIILIAVFVLFCGGAILCFALVIRPRKSKSRRGFPDYYETVRQMDKGSFRKLMKKYTEYDDMVNEEIINIARICYSKHWWLCAGMIVMIPLVLSILALAAMTVLAK